jgi:hypothetical protein
MSCPNCFCSDCQRERARWLGDRPLTPTTWPTIPFVPNVAPMLPGHWFCACGKIHPPGYSCITWQGYSTGGYSTGGSVGGSDL